jgi:hypothetical protein
LDGFFGTAGGRRTLYNEKLHNLNAPTNIIRVIKLRKMRLAGYVAQRGEMENVYKILVGKHEGKRPLGRLRCRWEDNRVIRTHLREIWWDVVDWVHLTQDTEQWRDLVKTVMDLWVLQKAGIFFYYLSDC